MQMNKPVSPNGNWIGLIAVSYAVGLTMFAFRVGIGDPSTRQAVLLCMTALVSNLMGLGAGILVGSSKSDSHPGIPSGPLPPGSSITQTDQTKVVTTDPTQ